VSCSGGKIKKGAVAESIAGKWRKFKGWFQGLAGPTAQLIDYAKELS